MSNTNNRWLANFYVEYHFLGRKWQNRRKLLTNTFHIKTLDMYNPSINKHAKVFTKKLLEACEDDKEISIMEYVTLCSLDIICGNHCYCILLNFLRARL